MTGAQPAQVRRRPSAVLLAQTLHRKAADNAEAAFCAPLAILLARHLRFDAADPHWADRDRLLIGLGLAGLVQAAANLLGEGLAPGLFDAAAEPIGLAAGIALAERMLAARFGRSLVDHRCWVLTDTTRLATGPVQEAACLAGAWRLGRLGVIACEPGGDDAAAPLGMAGFAAFGWTVRRVADGDAAGLDGALSAAMRSFKPVLILYSAGDAGVPDEADRQEEPESWRAAGQRGSTMRRSWLKRLARHASRTDLEAALAGRLPVGWHARLTDPPWLPAAGQTMSTAESIRLALGDIAAGLPTLAILPGDPASPVSSAAAEPARHGAGMLALGRSAALAGMALHGGVLPVAVHKAATADQVWPALDGAANAGLRLTKILVETHGICAHALAGLRATANLLVLRPADATEALECLELALRHAPGPSVLLVSEQAVGGLAERPTRTRATRGGHVAAGSTGPRAATLLASGPELHVALAARTLLLASGLPVTVVSLPCWSLFAAQDDGWRAQVLGTAPLIGLETSGGFGWERWLGKGLFISLSPAHGTAPVSLESRAAMVARAVERQVNKPPITPLP